MRLLGHRYPETEARFARLTESLPRVSGPNHDVGTDHPDVREALMNLADVHVDEVRAIPAETSPDAAGGRTHAPVRQSAGRSRTCWKRKARARSQSLLTVATEISRAIAVSSIVKPPK